MLVCLCVIVRHRQRGDPGTVGAVAFWKNRTIKIVLNMSQYREKYS